MDGIVKTAIGYRWDIISERRVTQRGIVRTGKSLLNA